MSTNTPAAPPEHSNNPDFEYGYLKKIILMLELAVVRIEYGMCDSHDSVATLTESFTALAGGVKHIQAATEQLPKSESRSVIEAECAAAEEKVHAAIIAFQFYDKLTQRLSHVSKSLVSLNALLSTPHRYTNHKAWEDLHDEIRSRYTLDSDQALLAALLAGKPLDEIMQDMGKNSAADDIELF